MKSKGLEIENGVLHALWDHIRNFFDNELEKGGAHPASSIPSPSTPFQGMGNGMPTSYTGHKHQHYREMLQRRYWLGDQGYTVILWKYKPVGSIGTGRGLLFNAQ